MKGWANSVFGVGNSLCKGCEARVCLVYVRKSKGARGPCKDSGSRLNCDGSLESPSQEEIQSDFCFCFNFNFLC